MSTFEKAQRILPVLVSAPSGGPLCYGDQDGGIPGIVAQEITKSFCLTIIPLSHLERRGVTI